MVEIPEDIQELIAREPGKARAWREATRAAFVRHLADGYRVTGFHRANGMGHYLLTRGAD